MILEVTILNVVPELTEKFEDNFKEAQKIISSMDGYISHELQKCIEIPNQYILLVKWNSLESHTKGFRESVEYQEWKNLLHHFYKPFPKVEHYRKIF